MSFRQTSRNDINRLRPFPPLLQVAVNSLLASDYRLGKRILKYFTYGLTSDLGRHNYVLFPPATIFRRLIIFIWKERSLKKIDLLLETLVALKTWFCSLPGYGSEKSLFVPSGDTSVSLHPFTLLGFDESPTYHLYIEPATFIEALVQSLRENNYNLVELRTYFQSVLELSEDEEEEDELCGEMSANCSESWKENICIIIRYIIVLLEDTKFCKALYQSASSKDRISEGKTSLFRYVQRQLLHLLGTNDASSTIVLKLCLQLSKKFSGDWDMTYIEEITQKMMFFHCIEPWKIYFSSLLDLRLRLTVIEFVFSKSETFQSFASFPSMTNKEMDSILPRFVEWMNQIRVRKDNEYASMEEVYNLLFFFLFTLFDTLVGLQTSLHPFVETIQQYSRPLIQALFRLQHQWEEDTEENVVKLPDYYVQLTELWYFICGFVF
eukprot:jgi/Galph1/4977/GphlegSOOS_G3614.1